jgi:hypothetical protein
MWEYLLPYHANDFWGFENQVDAVTEDIGVIEKRLGFEGIHAPSVTSVRKRLTRILYNWSNSVPTMGKKKLRMKEKKASHRKFR